MATVGHLVTLTGVIFFFFMLLDSHFERRLVIINNLGLPRLHKRIGYYLFKICYLNLLAKNLSYLPNSKIKQFLIKPYSNEFEKYKYFYVSDFFKK